MKKSSIIAMSGTLGIMLVLLAAIMLSSKYLGSKQQADASTEPILLGLTTADANISLPKGITVPLSSDQSQLSNQKQPAAKPAQPQPAREYAASESADKEHAKVVEVTLDNDQSFKMALYPDLAPITVANFLQKIQNHFYDGLIVFRVEPDGHGGTLLIQTGDPNNNGTGTGAIQAEYNRKPFLAGSVGIARANNRDVNSNSQFFVMVQPLSTLDNNYTNFGDVIEGLDVVAGIQKGQAIKTITILN